MKFIRTENVGSPSTGTFAEGSGKTHVNIDTIHTA